MLRLYSDGLLSKWGFDDGDLLSDYVDGTYRHPFTEQTAEHGALIALVQTYLLPALEQAVETEILATIHNPIRAKTVNGEVWDAYDWDSDMVLTPEFVEIPDDLVMAVLVTHG